MATVEETRALMDVSRQQSVTHPVWASSFDDDSRAGQLADDMSTGTSVTSVLFAIIALGTIAGGLTVWLIS